ncbi:MAG: choice-of-anchor V domain-containing protein [Pyrinomonadaceae bacterium]
MSRKGFARLGSLAVLVVFFGIGILFFNLPGVSGSKVMAFSSGPPLSVTNAPGEGNCTACHSDFPINSGGGGVAFSNVPETYTPGQSYEISVTTTQSNTIAFGFQMTALGPDGSVAGSFTLPKQTPNQLQIAIGQIEGHPRDYVMHTEFGLSGSGSRTWTFTWNAPSTDIGDVNFYVASNAADGDGSSSGDFIYTGTDIALSPSSVANSAKYDFDGDSKADVAIFRPGPGEWWLLRSSDGGNNAYQFGSSTDTVVTGDYTGDGKYDFAFWRPSTGEWFVLRSEDSTFSASRLEPPATFPRRAILTAMERQMPRFTGLRREFGLSCDLRTGRSMWFPLARRATSRLSGTMTTMERTTSRSTVRRTTSSGSTVRRRVFSSISLERRETSRLRPTLPETERRTRDSGAIDR